MSCRGLPLEDTVHHLGEPLSLFSEACDHGELPASARGCASPALGFLPFVILSISLVLLPLAS